MKMKLSEIQATAQNLAPIEKKRLPYDLAKVVAKNILALQSELKLIEENRVMIAKTYAEKDEHGELVVNDNCYSFTGDNMSKFKEEYIEFLETETDVELLTISETVVDLLDSDKYDTLTPAELIALDIMIE